MTVQTTVAHPRRLPRAIRSLSAVCLKTPQGERRFSRVGKVQLLLADPDDRTQSTFANEMKIDESNYVQLGWIAFMRDLAKRSHSETIARIKDACEALSRREGWLDPNTCQQIEDVDRLAKHINEKDLLTFGKLRAAWLIAGALSRATPHVDYPRRKGVVLFWRRWLGDCRDSCDGPRNDGHREIPKEMASIRKRLERGPVNLLHRY